MSERRSSQAVKRKELVARLNATCQRAFKAAADTAKMRGNPYVELAHFVQQLALSDRGDVQLILAEAGADGSRLAADMTRALDKLPYGASSIEEMVRPGTPKLSAHLAKSGFLRSVPCTRPL